MEYEEVVGCRVAQRVRCRLTACNVGSISILNIQLSDDVRREIQLSKIRDEF